VDPRSTYLAGGGRPVVDPQTNLLNYIDNLDLGGIYQSGKEKVKSAAAKAKESVKGLRTRYPNAGRYAIGGSAVLGAVPGVMTAYEELRQNRPAGAAGAIVGAGAQAGVSALGTKLLMGGSPLTKAVGLGLLGVGALIPEAAAKGTEYVQSAVRGVPITNEQSFINELRKREAMGELDANLLYEINRNLSDQEFKNLERSYPLVSKFRNEELVRNQALMASRGNQLARLSLLQTGGALATGGQAETGATVRTMIQSNPYAAATVF
jgi:hypothetical protein